jgi:hypothetical protein
MIFLGERGHAVRDLDVISNRIAAERCQEVLISLSLPAFLALGTPVFPNVIANQVFKIQVIIPLIRRVFIPSVSLGVDFFDESFGGPFDCCQLPKSRLRTKWKFFVYFEIVDHLGTITAFLRVLAR